MRNLIVLLPLLLMTEPTRVTSLGKLDSFSGTANKTGATSLVYGYPTECNGELVVLAIAKDNTSTASGDNSEITGITDTDGNVYTKAHERTNAGTAAATTTASLWFCKISGSTSGDNITVTFSASTAAKAMYGASFTVTSGASIVKENSTANEVDGGDAASLSLSSLPSREYLYLRIAAVEAENTGVTLTSTWTNFGSLSISVQSTSGGGGATNQCIFGEYKVATSTGETSDPTVTSGDGASVMAALYEQSNTVPGTPSDKRHTTLGVGGVAKIKFSKHLNFKIK